MSKNVFLVALSAFAVSGGPAGAQSRADQLLRQFRVQKIQMIEEVLFKKTSKTTTVVYLRQLEFGQPSPAFCGEALFGSKRDNFVIDLNTARMRVGLSGKDWAAIDCGGGEGETLIDLR